MVNLSAINKTKKAYTDVDHELLFLGIFQDKKLNSNQRSLDSIVENKLSPLSEADLVFIDPIGTGYSRAIGCHVGEEFWGVNEDPKIIPISPKYCIPILY